MKAFLIQQGLDDAIQPIDPKLKGKEESDPKKFFKMQKKTHNAIILNLTDKETTASGVWEKLESLYKTKSLANRLYMKERLYSYMIYEDRLIGEQIDDFNKSVDNPENVDGPLKNEDKAIKLLNSLPKSFVYLKDAMLYGRDSTKSSITLEKVQCALQSNELQKSSTSSHEVGGQALNVGKVKGKKKFSGQNKKHKFDTQKETRSCHYCKKLGNIKKDCFSWKRKKEQEENGGHNNADIVEEVAIVQALNIAEGRIE